MEAIRVWGDIIVLPDLGWRKSSGGRQQDAARCHGFDPTYDDMQVMFRACGPDFKKDTKLEVPKCIDLFLAGPSWLHITEKTTEI